MNDYLETIFRGLMEALFRYLPECTAENHEKPQPGQPMSQPRYEPRASRIRVKTVTATRIRSVVVEYIVGMHIDLLVYFNAILNLLR
jgi:hypothetical protein